MTGLEIVGLIGTIGFAVSEIMGLIPPKKLKANGILHSIKTVADSLRKLKNR